MLTHFLKDISIFHIERRGLVVKGFSPDLLYETISVGETLPNFIKGWFDHARDIITYESNSERDDPIWYTIYSLDINTYFYDIKKMKWYLLNIDYDSNQKWNKQYKVHQKLLTLHTD